MEIGYLLPEGPAFAVSTTERRSRDRRRRRSAARRAGHECALCAQRRQCTLGLALRCPLRHRRDPRDRRRRARARATIRVRGAKVIAWAPRLPGRGGAARRRELAWADYRRHGHRSTVRLAARRRSPTPTHFAGYRGSAGRPEAVLLQTPRPAHRDRHRSLLTRSARRTAPASPTSCWKPRSPPSRTARIRSPPSTPRTRSPPIATGSA